MPPSLGSPGPRGPDPRPLPSRVRKPQRSKPPEPGALARPAPPRSRPPAPPASPPVRLWPEAPSPSLRPVPHTLCPLPVPLPRRVGEAALRPVPPPSSVPAPPSSPQTHAWPRPGPAPSPGPAPPFPAPAPGLPAPLFPSPGPAPWPPEASPRPQPRPPEVSWAPGGPRDRTQRAAARAGVHGGGGARAARGVSGGAAGLQRTRDGGGGEGRARRWAGAGIFEPLTFVGVAGSGPCSNQPLSRGTPEHPTPTPPPSSQAEPRQLEQGLGFRVPHFADPSSFVISLSSLTNCGHRGGYCSHSFDGETEALVS